MPRAATWGWRRGLTGAGARRVIGSWPTFALVRPLSSARGRLSRPTLCAYLNFFWLFWPAFEMATRCVKCSYRLTESHTKCATHFRTVHAVTHTCQTRETWMTTICKISEVSQGTSRDPRLACLPNNARRERDCTRLGRGRPSAGTRIARRERRRIGGHEAASRASILTYSLAAARVGKSDRERAG